MKLKFSFVSDRPIGIYARLCNQFAVHPLVFGFGFDDNGYFLEAEGDEQALSDLAELIGSAFPLSCFVKGSHIEAIEAFSGSATELEVDSLALPYCRHCVEQASLACKHCGSAAEVEQDIDALAQTFIEQGSVSYQSANGAVTWSHLSNDALQGSGLLFCDAKALNESLHISNDGIKTLGSIEKPALLLSVREAFANQHNIEHRRYPVQLAADKIGYALSKALYKTGVTAVAISQARPAMLLSQFGERPVVLRPQRMPAPLAAFEPVNAKATYSGVQACYVEGKIHFSAATAEQDLRTDTQALAPWGAACTLEAIRQLDRFQRRSAVLYLSRQHYSGLLYKDDQGQYPWLVQLPHTGLDGGAQLSVAEAIAQLDHNAPKLVANFSKRYPERATVLERDFHGICQFSQALAQASYLVGIATPSDSEELAAQKMISAVEQYQGKVSQRIDFKVNKLEQQGSAYLQVDYRAAFRALMSYTLADESQQVALGYGFIDSFCDFVCNWVEQLDMDIGLDEVIIAGDEFDNNVLLERLRLRLGKNTKLRLPEPLDFDELSIAMGALYVPQLASSDCVFSAA
ncbi:hypothetical protein [Paraferrimonas haliotis]|uniref:Uncharacterized protein n=1 Tax=Paraferrimonas haliotis TaxID=2013866 RepID=A0AA37TR49_9GAMM|nr:hypothetical protein [Paraferrimonas haliotis]GLS82812.1 hypothetical protein GCM10007894_07890 [Paraferrimonas haliotis]